MKLQLQQQYVAAIESRPNEDPLCDQSECHQSTDSPYHSETSGHSPYHSETSSPELGPSTVYRNRCFCNSPQCLLCAISATSDPLCLQDSNRALLYSGVAILRHLLKEWNGQKSSELLLGWYHATILHKLVSSPPTSPLLGSPTRARTASEDLCSPRGTITAVSIQKGHSAPTSPVLRSASAPVSDASVSSSVRISKLLLKALVDMTPSARAAIIQKKSPEMRAAILAALPQVYSAEEARFYWNLQNNVSSVSAPVSRSSPVQASRLLLKDLAGMTPSARAAIIQKNSPEMRAAILAALPEL